MAKRNGSTVAASDDAPRALVGAGRRLRNPKAMESQGAYTYKALADVRQKLAWDFFDLIGEVKQATYFLANTCSLVRLFPGQLAEDEQIPTVPPEGTPGLAEARMALDRLRSGAGGHGWLVRDVVLNFKTAGECFLVGTVEADMESRPGGAVNVPGQQNPAASPADMVERWEIASVSMLQSDGDWFTLQRSRKGRKAALPVDAYLLRLWQQHPRFTDDADSALMGVITELEELLVLSRSVRAAARSRFAGNGILYVADELELEVANPQADDALDGEDDAPDLGEEIMAAASKAIADESDPSALVPIIVRGPLQMNGVSAKDALFHLKFGWDVDGKAHEARGELLGRLEVGLDIPVGSHSAGGKLNHWSAYQVDQSTWSRYGHPTMVTLVEALTSGYLRATMLEMGVAPEVVKSWVLWFDPAGAVVDPDKTTTITDAHDRLLISDEAGRTGLGFTEADAISDPEEMARRVAIKSAGKVGADGQPTAGPAGGTPPNGGTPPENVTAAGRRLPLGRRLARIDAKLFDRLQVLSDAALFRILERAGSRARTAAHRDGSLRNVVAAAPAHEVTRRLGPSVVASMGITDEELAAGALDGAEAQFMQRVKSGQQAALDVAATDLDLTEDELRALQGRQEDDRHAAWLWFSAALTTLATSRLYNPAETPARGETQPDSAVPAGLIRQAMNLAGGGVASADQPTTGVALGSLVLDTFAQHGQVVQSWVWDYGDGDRQRPFDPHLDLDGVAFNGWQDEALAVQAGDEWLGVGFYFPGDHMGCQCGVVADFGDVDAPAEATAE